MTWLVVQEQSGAFASFNLEHVENVSCDGDTFFVHVRGIPPRGFRAPAYFDYADLPALSAPVRSRGAAQDIDELEAVED